MSRRHDVEIDMSEEALDSAREHVGAIRSPEDVKVLKRTQIEPLCDDLRRVLIDRTVKNGGHLASNLGVVEATVAIHRVFDSPTDHIIFDVGHQSYVHKLLTGRAEAFDTLRCPGGLSGFPRRDESEHDAFGTGHASTSLSAAIGLAEADRLRHSKAFTVVVLGDGALTGGMIHEALNNCSKRLNIIVVLNENEMSISKNVGRFAQLLTKLRAARGYSCTKTLFECVLGGIPLIGKPIIRGLSAIKGGVKRMLYRSNYFESMGFNYFGPADGNDEARVEQLLRVAKRKGGCSLIHIRTVKGKGYPCAEHDPDTYHGLSPATSPAAASPTFSETFGRTLARVAEEREDVCAITAAMCQGTGLDAFAAAHPDRFFDVGIAESHAATFAAGLSAGGMLPVFAVYSTFLQRAYDQILHDAALQRLPMLLGIVRAGLNARDGATHHGIYDVALLSHIPGVDIYAPPTTAALQHRLEQLLTADAITRPVAVRYPSGRDDADVCAWMTEHAHPIGDGIWVDFDPCSPPETVALTYGRLSAQLLAASRACKRGVGVIVLEKLKPRHDALDLLRCVCENGARSLVLCEEGIRTGGLAATLSGELRELLPPSVTPDVRVLAIDERDGEIPAPKSGQTSFEAVGLDAVSIGAALDNIVK